MVKEFINEIKNLEKDIKKIMYKGFNFCYGILIISALILLFYILNPISYIIFESGIVLFKASLTFVACFFIGGVFTNKIKKDIY